MSVLALAVCIAPLQPLSASDDEARELQIRAAFLLNFIKLTTWPEEAFPDDEADLVVAVVGPDPFEQVLEQTFAQVKAQGRRVVIRRWSLPDRSTHQSDDAYKEAVRTLQGHIAAAHLVYLTICESDELDLALEGVDTSHVLTVGSEYGCATTHSALALHREGERVVFYANLRILKALRLEVSSRLLALARCIDGPGPRGEKP